MEAGEHPEQLLETNSKFLTTCNQLKLALELSDSESLVISFLRQRAEIRRLAQNLEIHKFARQ